VSVVNVAGRVKAQAAMAMNVVIPNEEALAVGSGGFDRVEPAGKVGPVLQGLELRFGEQSLDTCGREWDWVTPRSANRNATGLEVIDVPRTAWTTCGIPWTPKISFIISTANGPDSWA
jgi:hypothetical protein